MLCRTSGPTADDKIDAILISHSSITSASAPVERKRFRPKFLRNRQLPELPEQLRSGIVPRRVLRLSNEGRD